MVIADITAKAVIWRHATGDPVHCHVHAHVGFNGWSYCFAVTNNWLICGHDTKINLLRGNSVHAAITSPVYRRRLRIRLALPST